VSLEHSVYDPRAFVGDVRQGDEMMFAPLALSLINALEHRVTT